MAFCYNCGSSHNDGDMFCENCGVKLIDDAAETTITGDSREPIDNKSDGGEGMLMQGVIMTNISRLSSRFSISKDKITELLNDYIKSLRSIGIEYRLFDLSDKGCGDSWTKHAFELTKLHIKEYKGSDRPIFLFIIGGDDIIPMPTIDNLYYQAAQAAGETVGDNDVDTDLPYAYLLGENTQSMVYNGELFNHTTHFSIGRLPFDQKADISIITDYLQRASDCHHNGGLHIRSSYAQTFKKWQNESYMTSGAMNQLNLLPAYSQQCKEEYVFKNILTSPGVVMQNVQSVINSEANLLFFNMHGDGRPENPCFMGDNLSFTPIQVKGLQRENLVVTEACYGAKFKGLDADYSMLLTALKNKTLLYFGSSRIALGGGGSEYSSADDLIAADLYFKYLIDGAIMKGYPMGYTVEWARAQYISRCKRLMLKDLLTIAEFNLFGDPTLFTSMANAEKSIGISKEQVEEELTQMKSTPLSHNREAAGYTVETIYNGRDNSLLSQIRNQVDASLKSIVDTINKELYTQHGIEPRELSLITKTKFKDNSSSMEFIYNTNDKSTGVDKVYVVDVVDDVKRVFVSK